MKTKFKNNQGITLIALIITIIIMVILVAVSINSVYNMGIVDKATRGVQEYAQRAVEENEMMAEIANELDLELAKLKRKRNGAQKELLAPTITLTGTEGNNGWYKGNVTVTISDTAELANTATTKIKYTVTGANAITETVVNGRETTFTISTDGTSNITAYAVNAENTSSTSAAQAVKKDATVPSTATISVTSVNQTTIAVSGAGTDATSGVASYEFQISSTSTTEGFSTPANGTITTTNTSTTYTYTGLTAGTTYYIRVKVTDTAGNETTSSAATTITLMGEPTLHEYYKISVSARGDGSATANMNKVEKYSDEWVCLQAIENDGYFDHWEISGAYELVSGDEFDPEIEVIPRSDLTVTAVFIEEPLL